MYSRYSDHVQFLAVYIREAHPVDGWRMPSNDQFGINFSQPKTFAERTQVASKCSDALHLSMPLLVDHIDDRVERAYSAFPDRLYVISEDGQVVFKGGRGPFGYQPRLLEQALMMLLIDMAQNGKLAARQEHPPEPVAGDAAE